jgi:DNA-binding transcriptional regulator/RsmH inhibitor MraZ
VAPFFPTSLFPLGKTKTFRTGNKLELELGAKKLFLLGEAQPKNVLVTPPPKWKRLQRRLMQAPPKSLPARRLQIPIWKQSSAREMII